MSARSSSKRGQAIVESTLGILVFVTIALFGIHFTEITFTQMKVTEAAQAAIWESTAGQMHILPKNVLYPGGNFTDVDARIAAAVVDGNARYADFDGALGGGGFPKQILSTARPGSMAIKCRSGAGLPQPGAGGVLSVYEWLVYRDNGGMQCTSEAYIDVGGVQSMGKFLEDANGFFGASQVQSTAMTAGYHVCGLNKSGSVNGPCRGQFGMLIDDWGLASGGSEKEACPIMPYGVPCLGNNMNYWMAGNLIYQANSLAWFTQTGDDYNLVKTIVGTPAFLVWNNIPFVPGNPTSFSLSFCGENPSAPNCVGLFTAFTPWMGDGSWWLWQTTPLAMWPTYGIAYWAASGCYLGKPCNTASIANP